MKTLKNFVCTLFEIISENFAVSFIVIFFICANIAGVIVTIGVERSNKKESDNFYASAECIAYVTEIKDVTYDTTQESTEVSFYVWFENSLGEEIYIKIPKEEYREYIKAIGTEIEIIANVGESKGEKIEKDHILNINIDHNNLVTMNKLEK